MDRQLLEYYDRELRYIREMGGEFAREFPKVAGRLGLDSFACADPYVERLLEGFAFLAARVQLKIDGEFPRFTEQLLDLLCPHYLGPTPSMAVVQFVPDGSQGSLNEGYKIPRGTALTCQAGGDDPSPCEYRTAHDITLWPLALTQVSVTSQLASLGGARFPSAKPVKSFLQLRLRTTTGVPFSSLSLDQLAVFVRGTDAVSLKLFELIVAGFVGVAVRGKGASGAPDSRPNASFYRVASKGSLRVVGLEDSEALLPVGNRSYQGYRLLHEYFAFPQRYMIFEFGGLAEVLRSCDDSEVEIVLALDRQDSAVEAAVTASSLALHCTPIVNLFPKKADRIHLNDSQSEFHVVPDRTRPLDFEVHSVLSVTGIGVKGEALREFSPLYGQGKASHGAENPSYYSVHRRQRLPSAKQKIQGHRSNYLGGEVFLSLMDGKAGPFDGDLSQLGVQTLCTNRDLPLRLILGGGRSDFTVESGAPVESVRVVAGPSAPKASPVGGEMSWRLISHLSLNYLSFADGDDDRGTAALRELLELYADMGDAHAARQIAGVQSCATKPVVRRLPFPGPVTFGRGIELTLRVDDSAFEGTSAFLLGVVLDRFFSRYVSMNSFTETVLRSAERGEVARWPMKVGSRPSL